MRILFYCGTHKRCAVIQAAVLAGLRHHGLAAEVMDAAAYSGPDADIAVFYGLAGNLKRVQREYVAAGLKTVFFDLGYWGRFDGGKTVGFHRVVVNGLHATDYFQRLRHPPDRFRRFAIAPQPFARTGGRVVLCGMSAKASWVYDLEPEQWEREAVEKLRAATAREIHYRPKPSWPDAKPINGATWSSGTGGIAQALSGAWACVSHHSNAALDALIAGVPAFCVDGVAKPLSMPWLERIEAPYYPDEGARDQLLYDVAYTQYDVREIAEGKMWAYLRDEGLL